MIIKRNIILFEDIIEFIFLDGWWWYKCPSLYSYWYTFVEKYGYLFVNVGSFNGHIEVYFAATTLMLPMTVSMMTLREMKSYVTYVIKRFLFLSGTTLKLGTGDIVRYEVKTIEVSNKIWNTWLSNPSQHRHSFKRVLICIPLQFQMPSAYC